MQNFRGGSSVVWGGGGGGGGEVEHFWGGGGGSLPPLDETLISDPETFYILAPQKLDMNKLTC